MVEFDIHNVRFYEFNAKAIHCIAYNDEAKLLALSRSDNCIELWNCKCKPFKQHSFIGTSDSSIEALAWCGKKLFSAGLNGFILEYDLDSYQIKNKFAVTGGPTWCLALSPNKKILAAGTEQGYVCLFDVCDDELLYKDTLKRQDGRILSIGWHPNSDYLVTGSVNYVHLKSIKRGEILQFPVSRIDKQKETIVWCVALLEDMTIVTGDSRGKTCFWDGQFGTLINGIQTHQADVLTMEVKQDQMSVYVAGVDPAIVEMRLVDSTGKFGKRNMWVKSFHRRVHTHDVRAMALTQEGKLFSGGVDTYLALSYYPPKTAIKYAATPPKGYISLARNCHDILLGYEDRIELWQLGRGSTEGKQMGRFLSIKEDRVKLLDIYLKKGERLESCAVSPKSRWIAYVTRGAVKIFKFMPPLNNGAPSIKRIHHNNNLLPSLQVCWLEEGVLLSATNSNVLQIITVDESMNVKTTKTLLLPDVYCARIITSSAGGRLIAVVDTSNQVHIFDSEEQWTIPKTESPVTALAFSPKDDLIVTHSNMSLTEYDIKERAYSSFGKHLINNKNSEISKCSNVIQNVSFYGLNHIFLHSISSIFVLNKNQVVEQENSSRANKTMKFDPNTDTENSNSSLKMCTQGGTSTIVRTNHILYFSAINKGNLVSVEYNPIWLLDNLPPPFKTKKFGAM